MERIFMVSAVTIGERIILHLAQFSKFAESFDAPADISQDGIAEALRISRAHAAIELKKLKEKGDVVERISHIKRGPTKRKVYFLTEKGCAQANNLQEYVQREGIELAPLLDLKRCKGPDLWQATDPELRPVLGMACVFRKPFHREFLPPTTVTLLPEDKEGMVLMPADLREVIPGLLSAEQLRQYHSQAADYWLRENDHRERLYHLLQSGRSSEAERLVSMHSSKLLESGDRDLLALLQALPQCSLRYGFPIRTAQGSCARQLGELQIALKVAEIQVRSDDPRERYRGTVLRTAVLVDMGRFADAIQTAHGWMQDNDADDLDLTIEMTRARRGLGNFDEAKADLLTLLNDGKSKDPDDIERLYYEVGKTCLEGGDGREAVRHLSKALGISRPGDKARIHDLIWRAYLMIGFKEKAQEHAQKAGVKRSDWIAACPNP